MQILAKFKKILYMGFRATFNFRKFKVVLNVNTRQFRAKTRLLHFIVTQESKVNHEKGYWTPLSPITITN